MEWLAALFAAFRRKKTTADPEHASELRPMQWWMQVDIAALMRLWKKLQRRKRKHPDTKTYM